MSLSYSYDEYRTDVRGTRERFFVIGREHVGSRHAEQILIYTGQLGK